MKIKINDDRSKVTVSELSDIDWLIIQKQLKTAFDYECELLDFHSIGIAELQTLYKDKFSNEFGKMDSFKMDLPQAMAFVMILPFFNTNEYQIGLISDMKYKLFERLGQFLRIPTEPEKLILLQSPIQGNREGRLGNGKYNEITQSLNPNS